MIGSPAGDRVASLYSETIMSEPLPQRVVGIGGIFFHAKDPVALRAWYQKHLGVDVQSWGGTAFPWNHPEGPGQSGMTVWNIAGEDSKYFAPSTARFMINYIVRDLDAVLAALRAEGCDVDPKCEDTEFGKFGWVMDPEGHRVELWQPPAPPAAS